MAEATVEELTIQPQMERRKRRAAQTEQRGSDLLLLATTAALTILGLLVVYSATYALSYFNFAGVTNWYLKRQAMWAVIGVVALLVFWRIDYRQWQRWSTPLMGLSVLVLAAMFVIGQASFGATRWLLEGGSIQPSEAVKLVTIIYVAHWASSKEDRIRSVEVGLLPFGILIGLVCGLILMQPSFSVALLVGVVATTMFFIAGADFKQLAITGVAALGIIYLLLTGASYRSERLEAYRDPFGTEMDAGYQTAQVLYSLARGGVLGQGLGTSRGNVPALPAGHTDAILAIIGQEMGLVMCLFVLGLFLFLGYRGFRIANSAPDGFGTVLASGLTCWLLYQALFNVAIVTNTVPPTGIPMPFISFGGSGLVTALAGVGLLLSISRAVPPKRTVQAA
jgi:cell division protein FtsW